MNRNLTDPRPLTSRSSEDEAGGDGGSGASQQGSWPTAGLDAPGFLLPVLREVVLAGKSMEMLHNLGKLKQVMKGEGREHSMVL